MNYRKINIDGEVWRWKVGRGNVSVRSPENKHHSASFRELTGYGWDIIEKAQDKKYFHLTPKHIREHILEYKRKKNGGRKRI